MHFTSLKSSNLNFGLAHGWCRQGEKCSSLWSLWRRRTLDQLPTPGTQMAWRGGLHIRTRPGSWKALKKLRFHSQRKDGQGIKQGSYMKQVYIRHTDGRYTTVFVPRAIEATLISTSKMFFYCLDSFENIVCRWKQSCYTSDIQSDCEIAKRERKWVWNEKKYLFILKKCNLYVF